MDATLVLMMGLPRSGKSTIAKRLSKEHGWPIVNRDSVRLALHGQRYESLAEPMVKAIAIVMARSLFFAGHDVVIVDETSIKRSTREFWGSGRPTIHEWSWDVHVYDVGTSREVCLERAALTNDEQIVPVINRMADDFEPLQADEVIFQEPPLETPGKNI